MALKQPSILEQITIRQLNESDSFEDLTDFLHRSYKKLADMGFRYLATHQSPETTKERATDGTCFVALLENKIIATVTYYNTHQTGGTPWYDKKDVCSFGQFAVEPEFQGMGIGKLLLDLVESKARIENAKHIALDTAEGAEHLIKYYEKRGYKFIEYAQWNETNYRSVIMNLKLT
jgi:GNAT superfamily N-acetyltransferase